MSHRFILEPGEWLGQGKLTFNTSSNVILFYTKWFIGPLIDHSTLCEQRIERSGMEDELLINFFRFSFVDSQEFTVDLESKWLGSIQGKGVVTEKWIQWEFKQAIAFEGSSGFLGTETYWLQDNGEYSLTAQYQSSDHITHVQGRLWQKVD